MNFVYLIGGILSLSIFIFLFFKLFFGKKEYDSSKVFSYLIGVGFGYLVLAVLSFFWFFNILEYSSKDYFLIYIFCILLQNLIFFKIVFLFSKNKNLYFLLIFYIISLPLLILFRHSSFWLFMIASFLFSLILFIHFSRRHDSYKRLGYIGIFYSVLSLVLSFLLFFSFENVYYFGFVSMGVFLYLLFVFSKDLRNYSFLEKKGKFDERSYLMSLLSHLAFVVTLVSFIFIGTVAIHEFGHFSTSKFFDCDSRKIIYEGDFFHTEVLCSEENAAPIVAGGGILLPFILALILILFQGKFSKEIAFLIIGFNGVAISKDLSVLGISENLIFGTTLFGIIFVVWGLYNLIKSKTEEEIFNPVQENLNLFK